VQGFLTPAHLHFVRNHGAVPQVDEEMARNWTISIGGLVRNPTTFTLQELKERFPVVTLPVTLVCAGNRRKEQNVVRKSLGFNWGAAGGDLPPRVTLAQILTPRTRSEHGALDRSVPGRCACIREASTPQVSACHL
jgi:hypothetical protein